MRSHLRCERTLSSSAPLALHPLTRAAIVLLALIQVIAPTWHVCALGGGTRHHAPEEKVEVWKPKCGGGKKCPCVPPKGKLVSPTGASLSKPADECPDTNCLARLLMGMPGSLAAPFDFISLATRRPAFASSLFVSPSVAFLPQPPSRGPPRASV